jgi:hypothetical protein
MFDIDFMIGVVVIVVIIGFVCHTIFNGEDDESNI